MLSEIDRLCVLFVCHPQWEYPVIVKHFNRKLRTKNYSTIKQRKIKDMLNVWEKWKWFIFLSSNEEGVNKRKCMGECVFLCINGLTEIFFWKTQTNLLDIFGCFMIIFYSFDSNLETLTVSRLHYFEMGKKYRVAPSEDIIKPYRLKIIISVAWKKLL